MVQSYIPTSLIVIISWVSFWIDRRAVPARVTLSFTTLLSLTTIGNGMRYALPQVSYAKAIDYWFGACMLFVFLALLEFALVNSYMRRSDKYEKLSNKYSVDREEFVMASPMVSSHFRKSYEQLQKMRRKSSAGGFLSGVRRSTAAAISPLLPRKKSSKAPVGQVRFQTREDEDDARDAARLLRREQRKRSREYEGQLVNAPAGGYTNSTAELCAIMDEEDNNNDDPFGSYYDNVPRVAPAKIPVAPMADEESNLSGSIIDDLRRRRQSPDDLESVPESESTLNAEQGQQQQPNGAVMNDPEIIAIAPAQRKRYSVAPNQKLSIQYLEASQILSRRALNIDKTSRYVFPLVFLIFNVFYWFYYLVWRDY